MKKRYLKGKAWRRERMTAGEAKAAKNRIYDERGRVIPMHIPTQDPSLNNKQRLKMRRAARAYRQTGGQ